MNKFSFCLLLIFAAAATSAHATVAMQRSSRRQITRKAATRPVKTRSIQPAGETFCREPTVQSAFEVRQVDAAQLAALLKSVPNNKRPLLVNFWATWCVPCREEFPDLVKIDNEFRKRGLDFFTVSLDDREEVATTVPAFLGEMKAVQIPAYLLNAPEPADVINVIDKAWSGALPATFLFDRQGQVVFKHTGRINAAELSAAIKKALE